MKKVALFALSFLLFAIVGAKAQMSVELDARLAPWGGDMRENMGTDVVLNYKLSVANIFVMPSAGMFYKKYTKEIGWEYIIPGGGPYNPPYKTYGYQTGFDFTVVIGKDFKLGVGKLGFFTGPRYSYAFARSQHASEFNRNGFDWRIGACYSFWKLTASVKVDIACLKVATGYKERQSPTLAIGLAYSF